MSAKNTVVFGIYPNESEIVEAIDQLKRLGFRAADLSILLPENLGSKDIGHEKHTKAPEGAVAGAVVGGLIGAALGWLTNAGFIQLSIAEASGLMSATPAIAIFASMGVVGLMGAIVGALVGVTRPEYEAKRYQGRIRSKRILLSVHCDSAEWRVRAKNALRHTGADGVASTMEAKADFAISVKPRPRAEMKMPLAHRTFLAGAEDARVTAQPPLTDSTMEEIGGRTRTPVQ